MNGVHSRPARIDVTRTIFRLVILAVVLLLPFVARAETEFERGNTLYEAANYADAAKTYERLVQGGASGPNLFYNLGNAYLRAGDNGRAVLNYQRALALQPAHPEAAANLGFLRRTLGLAASAPEGIPVFTWLDVDAWSVIAATGVWTLLAGLVLLFGPWRRPTPGWSLTIFGVGLFLVGVAALVELRGGARNGERAIVVGESGTRAHYAPADNSRDVQMLAVGSEIRVLQDRGSWTYAELAGGARGWVASNDLERVVPN